MIKVSVIIPVYNGEKHLTQCMDSVCNQTLQEIEIICVDDGSTDHSVEILKSYQNKDSRIQIYQQNHKYAGAARNLGKSHATGDYLVFWDCDDFFDKQALEKLYKKMIDVDAEIGVCGANEYLESKQKTFPHPSCLNIKRVPKEDPFDWYSNSQNYLNFTNGAAWNKIFKRQYIEDLGLNFQTVRNGNDVYFTEVALGLANRITCLNEQLVTYRVDRDNGLVSSLSKASLDPIQAWIDIANRLEDSETFEEKPFANKALGSMIYLLSNLRSWGAFSETVAVLQEYGLQKMHITQHEEGYYDSNWHTEFVNHIYNDTAEEMAVFLANYRYTQYFETNAELRGAKARIKEQKEQVKNNEQENEKKIKSLKQEIDQIRNSWTFRIGKAITWLPGKMKKAFMGSN